MTAKKKILTKCLQSIQNNDPELMENTVEVVELDCGTQVKLETTFIKKPAKEKALKLVIRD